MAEQHNDEIDLGELVLKIRNVLKRYALWFVIFTIIGLSLGLVYYQLKPAVYQSEIVIRAEILNGSLLKIINQNLTRVIEEGSTGALAAKLNVPPEIADEVLEINIEGAAENGETSSFYMISVKSLSNKYWDKLEQGILNYLENNAYVKKRINTQEERYENYVSKLDAEIQQLDSLKLNMGAAEKSGRDNFIVMNPSDIYSTLIALYKQRQQYKEELDYNTAVEIVEEFEAYERPVSPRPVFSMGIGAMLGLLLSFILVGARELDSYLKRYDERVRA